MDFWMLTEKGRHQVFEIERKPLDDEGKLIKYLNRVGSAPVENIVSATGIPEVTVNAMLKRLSESSWVWKKSTRFTSF